LTEEIEQLSEMLKKQKNQQILLNEQIENLNIKIQPIINNIETKEKIIQEKKVIYSKIVKKKAEDAFKSYLNTQSTVFDNLSKVYGQKVFNQIFKKYPC
jgi:hypothetical protein